MSGSRPEPTLIFFAYSATPSDNLVENRLFDVEARPGAAALAVIEEDRAGGTGDRGLEIGIFEHDVRRFAAEFQRHFFQVAGGGMDDQFADFGRPGEGNFVDVGMRGQARRPQSRRSPGRC